MPRVRVARSALFASAAAVAALALTPLVYLAIRAAGAGAEHWSQFARASLWQVFANSALLAVVTTAGAIALGVPLAWLTTRTDLPWRRFWSVVTILPLTIPSYIGANICIALLGPRGMLAQSLEPFGVERLPEIYGLPGTVLVLTLINYPFVLLSVRAALSRMDPSLEEAARGLGSDRWQIFRRVTLPQLRPAIAAGGLLVALYALSDFGAPALLQFRTFTRVIYSQLLVTDLEGAALMALPLVALTMIVLAAEAATRGRARYHRSVSGAQRPAPTVKLGRWRWPALGFCAAVSLAALAVPIVVLVYWTARGASHGQPVIIPWKLIWNSVSVSMLAAGAAVAVALPVVIVAVRFGGRLGALVDRAAYVGNALPGIVIALALVYLGIRNVPLLYQTLPLLIIAYVIRFLPESIGCMRTSMLQIAPRLEEASRGLGRSPLATFAAITAPLLAPGVLAGAALVFLTTMKELPVTLFLRPTGYETLATEIWYYTTERMFSQASPPALLLVAVSALSVGVILRQEERTQNG